MRFAQFEDHKGAKDERVMLLTGDEMKIFDAALVDYVKANPRKTSAKKLLKQWDLEAPLYD